MATVVGSGLRYELNQLRFGEGDDENSNLQNLQAACQSMIQSILHSSEHIPRYQFPISSLIDLSLIDH